MFVILLEFVDVWCMVLVWCFFVGMFFVVLMFCLCGMLVGSNGEVDFELEFGCDELGMVYFDVCVEVLLIVIC